MQHLDLTEDEAAAPIKELHDVIEGARYPFLIFRMGKAMPRSVLQLILRTPIRSAISAAVVTRALDWARAPGLFAVVPETGRIPIGNTDLDSNAQHKWEIFGHSAMSLTPHRSCSASQWERRNGLQERSHGLGCRPL